MQVSVICMVAEEVLNPALKVQFFDDKSHHVTVIL